MKLLFNENNENYKKYIWVQIAAVFSEILHFQNKRSSLKLNLHPKNTENVSTEVCVTVVVIYWLVNCFCYSCQSLEVVHHFKYIKKC